MLFHKHIHFGSVDPLGNGLREEIMQEQAEPEAIHLDEDLTEAALEDYWHTVDEDLTKDPLWTGSIDE